MGQCAKVTGLSGKTNDLSRGDKITLENLSPNRASSADPTWSLLNGLRPPKKFSSGSTEVPSHTYEVYFRDSP
jgi:hypothetical protein